MSLVTCHSSLVFLYLIPPDLLDDVRVGLTPTSEVAHIEWKFYLRELFVGLIQGLVRDRAEVVFDEGGLSLVAPQVLQESRNDGTLLLSHFAVNNNGRVFAEDG